MNSCRVGNVLFFIHPDGVIQTTWIHRQPVSHDDQLSYTPWLHHAAANNMSLVEYGTTYCRDNAELLKFLCWLRENNIEDK